MAKQPTSGTGEVTFTEHAQNESAPGTEPWILTLQPSQALTPQWYPDDLSWQTKQGLYTRGGGSGDGGLGTSSSELVLCVSIATMERKQISVHFVFTSELTGLCPKFSNNISKDRPTKPVIAAGTRTQRSAVTSPRSTGQWQSQHTKSDLHTANPRLLILFSFLQLLINLESQK